MHILSRIGGNFMYVSEFWCGVLATILIEIIALVGYTISDSRKKKDKSKEK